MQNDKSDNGNRIVLSDAVIGLSTRSDASTYTDITYRFCLFSNVSISLDNNTTYHTYTGRDGTYCDPNPSKDSRWLTPCKVVDDTGAYDNDESTVYGLQSRDGTYYMAIASPAVAMTNMDKDKHKDIYGFEYNRERTEGENVLCISDSIKAVIKGLTVNDCWLYIVNDTLTLKERRSRLKISISCGDDISSAIVKKICISNIVDKGWYNPADQDFQYTEANISQATVKQWDIAQTLYSNADEGAGHLKTYKCENAIYLLSMDYSKVDKYMSPVYAQPSIDVYLGENGENKVAIPIAYPLKPEYEYDVRITINSCYVTLFMTVLNWDDAGSVNGEMSYPYQRQVTIKVHSWDNGTNGTDGETTIDDSKVVK